MGSKESQPIGTPLSKHNLQVIDATDVVFKPFAANSNNVPDWFLELIQQVSRAQISAPDICEIEQNAFKVQHPHRNTKMLAKAVLLSSMLTNGCLSIDPWHRKSESREAKIRDQIQTNQRVWRFPHVWEQLNGHVRENQSLGDQIDSKFITRIQKVTQGLREIERGGYLIFRSGQDCILLQFDRPVVMAQLSKISMQIARTAYVNQFDQENHDFVTALTGAIENLKYDFQIVDPLRFNRTGITEVMVYLTQQGTLSMVPQNLREASAIAELSAQEDGEEVKERMSNNIPSVAHVSPIPISFSGGTNDRPLRPVSVDQSPRRIRASDRPKSPGRH